MRLDNDSKSNRPTEVQLSLMDYQLGKLDFDETSKSKGKVPYAPIAKNKTPRFLTLSAAVHAAAFFTLAFASIPLVSELKPETITIELADSSDAETPVHKLAQGADVEATQGSQVALPVKEDLAEKPEPAEMAPALAQTAAPKIASEDLKLPESAPIIAPPPQDIAEEKEEVVAKKAEPTKAAPIATAKAPAQKAVAKTAPAKPAAAKTTMAAVPATIEDIQDPELDKGEVADHSETAPLAEDFNDDLDKEDSKQAAALAKEKENMDQMAASIASEQDETLNNVAKENAEEAKKLAAANENMKQKNAAMVAKAEAAERAEKEAQVRADQEAAQARAAAAQQAREEAAARAAAAQAASLAAAKAQAAQAAKEAQQASAAGQGNGSGQGVGDGTGNAGAATANTQLAGAPTGVRSLEQLRQKPGNPRPMYSPQERLLGQTGEVGFVAYITKEGVPTQFKMIKSTGYQNLDSKTLAALKKWKFYPGQEGWVELPFKWDLKGETQEAGGLLRNSVSSR